MKAIVFRYYIPIAVIACLAAIITVVLVHKQTDWILILTILGGVLSSIYFVQKQKLEETRLFKELFTEFNKRYDKMNDNLNRICQSNPEDELTSREINDLYDYFNLCGEEYLFYKQGYILSEVWEPWLNGMRIFYQDKRIRELWEEELKTNSYYGFKLDFLQK